jgi:para-nitrobenzyl esterase
MKKIFVCLTIAINICASVNAQLQTGENVAVTNTDAGKVRGYIHNSIYTYKGIPYAQAKRFRSRTKTNAVAGCSQFNGVWTGCSLCSSLRLRCRTKANLYITMTGVIPARIAWSLTSGRRASAMVKKRPVMFWIHGGGFTAGSSEELPSYDGESLAKTGDVVVVSINHRLNILGFLDLSAYGEKYKHSANASILDIEAALQWVKANISNFGGDANNVTIFGQSGGGAKVNTLMAMPSAKGLFQKAINESGSFRTDLVDKSTTQEIAAEVLSALNLQPNQADSLQTDSFYTVSGRRKKGTEDCRR